MAYACSPLRGSEEGVGWGWVTALAEHHDLWVLTASHWRPEIEPVLAKEPGLGKRLRFIYVPRRWRRAVALAEKFWPPIYLASYKHQWQRDALNVAQRLHREVGFDLVHQITYVGFRVPGEWWRLGIPFVWGPIGGLEQTPWHLLLPMGPRGIMRFACRNFWNEYDRRFSRRPREAFRKAAAIIAATEGIQKEIFRFFQRDAAIIPEVGLPPVSLIQPPRREPGEPLRLLWCGRHIPSKALPLLFQSLKLLPRRIQWRLEILGSGPCTEGWKRQCRRLDLEERCVWKGNVPRNVALARMMESHVLVITSLYELTSTVTVEGLALGLPVICPDLYGFRDAVTDGCGIRVPARSIDSLVRGIAEGITRLHDHEEGRLQMAEAAIRQAERYRWEIKAQRVNTIYTEVASRCRVEVVTGV